MRVGALSALTDALTGTLPVAINGRHARPASLHLVRRHFIRYSTTDKLGSNHAGDARRHPQALVLLRYAGYIRRDALWT